MPNLNRRDFVTSTAFAAALGFTGKLAVSPAFALQDVPDPKPGFHKYKVGSVEVTALYDGIWRKPHDPGFIRNASVDETKAELEKAHQITEFMPIPLTVVVLKINGEHILVDSGSGAGQWQPTAGHIAGYMQAAGIDPKSIKKILISHFHPDHIFGLLEKGTNKPTFPDAELIVTSAEYKWWTEEGRIEKLPEARKGLGQRIHASFPNWKNFRLIDGEKEVAPGVRLINTPGHTPGHASFVVSSGNKTLMVSNDVAYVPALLAPHPEWQGTYDQDGPLAVTTRRKLLDQVIADKMMICGAHFPFPGTGQFVKDGDHYAFTTVSA
ncbi:MBL fold metallo-hydrolase [Rhodoplanes sp. Z2-YC6860]|uniref:MBL fold metallo-hydrolase n=1 Tax=Rhodoplanes sp. Z2-YC6860 TaxID=674703 RepID=UPI00078C4660|nr:MBL fold metallo-hydrolase [Rhodoplanes sp. Z2-YC6860]AMN42170.1 Zn-dependent hydrolase, glyoxylase [Rhodoplanes sp. Z2-YC6860]